MCGLFGIVFPYDEEATPAVLDLARNVFSYLAVFSARRGTDSTGIFVIDKEGNYGSYKGLSASYDMISDQEWWDTLEDADENVHMLMGHTRFATNGAIASHNTHPFVFTEKAVDRVLIGAHNGVIINDHEFGAHENDSKNILENLFDHPMDQWVDILDDIWGSFALSIWVSGTIVMARNSDSPLMLMDVPELGGATVYASEEHIIRSALTSANVPNASADIRYFPENRMIIQTKADKPVIRTLYSFTAKPTNAYCAQEHSLWAHEIEYDERNNNDQGTRLSIDSDTEFEMKCYNCDLMLPSRYLALYGNRYICENCSTNPRQPDIVVEALNRKQITSGAKS